MRVCVCVCVSISLALYLPVVLLSFYPTMCIDGLSTNSEVHMSDNEVNKLT